MENAVGVWCAPREVDTRNAEQPHALSAYDEVQLVVVTPSPGLECCVSRVLCAADLLCERNSQCWQIPGTRHSDMRAVSRIEVVYM